MAVPEGIFVATPKSSNRRGIGSSPSPSTIATASVLLPFSDITDTANSDASNSSSIATLQKDIDPVDGSITIHSTIPSGFAIVDHDVFDGKKIVATQPFQKGDVMYVGHALMLDLSSKDSKFKLCVYAPEHDERNRLVGVFENSSTHSVDDHAPASKLGAVSKRQVYGWDGFMNHSCSPNAYFPLISRTPTEMSYQAIAIRDIATGDEITCDYALFDYECNGHEIEACACGSLNCRGKMLGFRGKQAMYMYVLMFLLRLYMHDDENISA